MKKMKRVLLVCVGRRDPYNPDGTDGPILSFCKYLRRFRKYRRTYLPIQAIYLLSTAKKPGSVNPTQRNAEETKEILEKERWEVFHRPLNVLDPTDYGELTPAMVDALITIYEECGEECEYLINVSPGTGQMEAVWISLYNAGLFPKATLLQVKKPQDEPDIMKRIREVNVVPLREPLEFSASIKHLEDLKRFMKGICCIGGRIFVDGKEVTSELSKLQLKLVQFLCQHCQKDICDYDDIKKGVYGTRIGVTNNAVRELVKRVRKKIDPGKRYILTTRGGYYLKKPT